MLILALSLAGINPDMIIMPFGCSLVAHELHIHDNMFQSKWDTVVFTGSFYHTANPLPLHLNTTLDSTNGQEQNRNVCNHCFADAAVEHISVCVRASNYKPHTHLFNRRYNSCPQHCYRKLLMAID